MKQTRWLGHRGCRLAITYPEIPSHAGHGHRRGMINCRRKGIKAMPEIMIPLVGTHQELGQLRAETIETIAAVKASKKYSGNSIFPWAP